MGAGKSGHVLPRLRSLFLYRRTIARDKARGTPVDRYPFLIVRRWSRLSSPLCCPAAPPITGKRSSHERFLPIYLYVPFVSQERKPCLPLILHLASFHPLSPSTGLPVSSTTHAPAAARTELNTPLNNRTHAQDARTRRTHKTHDASTSRAQDPRRCARRWTLGRRCRNSARGNGGQCTDQVHRGQQRRSAPA